MKTLIESLLIEGLTDDLSKKWSQDTKVVTKTLEQFRELNKRFPGKLKQPQTFPTLDDFQGHLQEFTQDTLFRDNAPLTPTDIGAPEVKVVSQSPSGYLLKIDNFEQSQYYGSNDWCVSRKGNSKHHFDNYTRNGQHDPIKFHFLILPKEQQEYQKIAICIGVRGTLETFNNSNNSTEITTRILRDLCKKHEIDISSLKFPEVFLFRGKDFEYWLDGDTMVFQRFNISDMGLENLKGLPKKFRVVGSFNCAHNNLAGLSGLPEGFSAGEFYCNRNELTSLKGLPEGFRVDGGFYCSSNKLTDLEGLPKDFRVGGNMYCLKNNLSIHEPKPEGVEGDIWL